MRTFPAENPVPIPTNPSTSPEPAVAVRIPNKRSCEGLTTNCETPLTEEDAGKLAVVKKFGVLEFMRSVRSVEYDRRAPP
jgi:hypothetical protein